MKEINKELKQIDRVCDKAMANLMLANNYLDVLILRHLKANKQ